MSSRMTRLIQWGIALVVAAAIFALGQIDKLPEKQQLTVYAPADMEEAFEDALNMSELSKTHQIVMSDSPNSNICVAYGKEGDETYQRFAFSPFVVAYNYDEKCLKKLKKTDVVLESPYDSNYYEIDLLKIINEAVGEGQWKNLGIEEQGDLRVFYPDKESVYWNDFYDLMLVTLNNGVYPVEESEIANIEETINMFINSRYTQGVTDFYEQVKRTGGFPSTAIYILPEQIVKRICVYEGEVARFFYPTNTVYVNYYVKGDELGDKVIEAFDESNYSNNFYASLKNAYYRNSRYSELSDSSNAYGDGNVYNVVKIP